MITVGDKSLDSLNAVAVGISIDSVPCKKAWAESLGIKNTRLLADFWPHGGVAQIYGVFRDKDGFAERANILIDREDMSPSLKSTRYSSSLI